MWGWGSSYVRRGRTALRRGGPGGCPLAGYGNQVAASGHPPGPAGDRPSSPDDDNLPAPVVDSTRMSMVVVISDLRSFRGYECSPGCDKLARFENSPATWPGDPPGC